MAEKFSLKWNDFNSNVSKSFGILRDAEYLHDVTLVSDDHQKISAHKFVLSACSEYFQDIFKNNQHLHPLVCLDNVSSEDLKNVLDYIYNGEAQIYQENLDKFLAVAKRLKLQGLIENIKEKDEMKYTASDSSENITKKEEMLDTIESVITDELFSNYYTDYSIKRTQNYERAFTISSNIDMNTVNDKIKEYMEECTDGSFKCAVCGKLSVATLPRKVQRLNMSRHIEIHMEGLTYTCPLCPKTARTRKAMFVHKSRYHN